MCPVTKGVEVDLLYDIPLKSLCTEWDDSFQKIKKLRQITSIRGFKVDIKQVRAFFQIGMLLHEFLVPQVQALPVQLFLRR
ncbi:hypothetical protein CEXT_253781 [Caerostris extrusa]|uniref:Uncharacterized protein n=1 Tax=Caerostris extrusa TaxID=172846 RepID=A0AAV4SL67_CAEEX|nr:hypothetical protein CEXT_253781 [Caerostris extrusa]